MLLDFIMDAPEVIAPWFMYWNRLAIYMSNFCGPCMPPWGSYGRKIVDATHVPADYLFTASLWGFYDLLEVRLRSKPDPLLIRSIGEKHNALQLACKHGNYDVAEFLIDWGWGLQVENGHSLLSLAIDGLLEMEDSLSLPSNAIIDHKYIETIGVLISQGVDPNEISMFSDPEPTFPILEAVRARSTKLVRLLLASRASPDVEDYWGLKAFHLAALEGEQEIAELLLAASTDVDDFPRKFCREVVLVHKALREDDETLLNLTLEQWPQDARGRKYLDLALWRAVLYNTEACMKTLLAKGADANMRHGGKLYIL